MYKLQYFWKTVYKKNSYQVEHSVRMSCELGHLGEWWVFPHQDLVLGVAVCADLVDINGGSQYRIKHLIWLGVQVLVLPARWRVWTRPGCRPVSRCRYSVTPVQSECSRSEGSGPPFPLRRPADRAGEETRRWPSQRPDDRCTAAQGASWSCSTPVTNNSRQKHREYHAI